METVNHTPFPAQTFEAIDQHGQRHHVAVLRQTLSFASGRLEYADRQAPLCDDDVFFDDAGGGVRQESDFCPYKPQCDVIVNATAHPPAGAAVRQFSVRLTVSRPDRPWPLPERPRGYNPYMRASDKELARWSEEVERAKRRRAPGERLIDKTLTVTGERAFREKSWPARLLQWAVQWATLTLLRPNPWKLTRAQPCAPLPLRHAFAFGGQCRIDAGDDAARKVRARDRLTPEQLAAHPERDAAPLRRPLAHAVFDANPRGRGFVRAWHLRATGQDSVPAPQVERPGEAITAGQFWRRSKPSEPAGAAPPAGLGIVDKSHPTRSALLGALDPAFIQGDAPLPADFDFAFWNAAPADQRIDFPRGDEIFELINLCRPGAPGARANAAGDTVLRLSRPEQECFLRLQLADGKTHIRPLVVDTVLIEPEDCALTLVWRLALPQDDAAPVVACEFRMRTFSERDRLPRDIDSWRDWNSRSAPTRDEAAAEVAP